MKKILPRWPGCKEGNEYGYTKGPQIFMGVRDTHTDYEPYPKLNSEDCINDGAILRTAQDAIATKVL